MKVRAADLSEESRRIEYEEAAAVLNEAIDSSRTREEQHYAGDVTVAAELYRFGTDVHLNGSVRGRLRCVCVRCLDEFERPLSREFRYLLVASEASPDLEPDAGLDRYDGEEIDVGALAREQAILALESVSLCGEECRGLCAGCGSNLNREACRC